MFTLAMFALLPLLARAAPRGCIADQNEDTPIPSSIASPPADITSAGFSPSPSPSPIFNSTNLLIPTGDCTCGYILTAFSDAYFPLSHTADFTTLPPGKLTAAQVLAKGWRVSDGWQAGATGPSGTIPMASVDTFSAGPEGLLMTVPGGYSIGQEVPVAEMTFDIAGEGGVTAGVFTMEAELDDTWGTCQSIFTYRVDGSHGDEQDIEMISQTISKAASNGSPPGIQLTNWDPSSSGENSHTVVPFNNDPTSSFNKYTIAWLPDGTKYYYNGEAIDSPKGYSAPEAACPAQTLKAASINPSNIIINHWSAGIEGFTEGPPTQDVVMKVKSTTVYYQTPSQSGLPDGCSMEQACRV